MSGKMTSIESPPDGVLTPCSATMHPPGKRCRHSYPQRVKRNSRKKGAAGAAFQNRREQIMSNERETREKLRVIGTVITPESIAASAALVAPLHARIDNS